MPHPEVSIVTSVYRDAALIPNFLKEVEEGMTETLGPDWKDRCELIFVHDGSGSEQWEAILEHIKPYQNARAFDLSRNYGQHVALICAYQNALGDAVIRLNLDCQDPPSEIPKLYKAFVERNHDIVVGIQERRESPFMERLTGAAFFKVFNFLAGSKIPFNTSSLRIMNRKFVAAMCSMGDKEPFLQGLESLCGFSVGYETIHHRTRKTGRSSYTALRRCGLAVDAAVMYSDRPLRLAIGFGVTVCVVGLLAVLVQLVLYFRNTEFLSGYLSLITIIIIFFGIQITLTGIVGIYVGKTLLHAQNRPLYLLKSTTDV